MLFWDILRVFYAVSSWILRKRYAYFTCNSPLRVFYVYFMRIIARFTHQPVDPFFWFFWLFFWWLFFGFLTHDSPVCVQHAPFGRSARAGQSQKVLILALKVVLPLVYHAILMITNHKLSPGAALRTLPRRRAPAGPAGADPGLAPILYYIILYYYII